MTVAFPTLDLLFAQGFVLLALLSRLMIHVVAYVKYRIPGDFSCLVSVFIEVNTGNETVIVGIYIVFDFGFGC